MRSTYKYFAGATALLAAFALSHPDPEPIQFELESEIIQVSAPEWEPTILIWGLPEIETPDVEVSFYREISEEVECLALNVYHEARGSSVLDQIGTSHVVLNRVAEERYPDSICEVVYQPYQFSWTHDSISDTPYEGEAWEMSQIVAQNVYDGLTKDLTNGATHYHTTAIRPYWSRTASNHQVIGAHVYMVAR